MGTLYYGDNLDILRRYLKDETVDLVYLDPPFNSAQNYNAFFHVKGSKRMSCVCRTPFVPVSALGPSGWRFGAGSAPHEAIFLILLSRMQSEVCGGAQPGADESRRGGPRPDSLLRRGRH
jgi:hypothetical protein